jgi:cell division septation protein DedD
VDRSYNSDSFDEPIEHDREISLGTPTILGIFFALALVCALFFGLGYSMGRKSQPVAASAPETDNVPTTSSVAKPASGSPAAILAPNPAASQTSRRAPAEEDAPAPKPVSLATTPQPRTVVVSDKPAATPVPSSASPGTLIVQIAAVSHREDADVLITTLQRRGYNVSIRQEPQDKLLHVQIGPFPLRKDADAMRQRLLSDGYNAIVK